MRTALVISIPALALFAWALTRVSTDALAMALGMLLGVVGAVTPTMMILLTRNTAPPPTYIVLDGRIGINTPEHLLSFDGDVPVGAGGEAWNRS